MLMLKDPTSERTQPLPIFRVFSSAIPPRSRRLRLRCRRHPRGCDMRGSRYWDGTGLLSIRSATMRTGSSCDDSDRMIIECPGRVDSSVTSFQGRIYGTMPLRFPPDASVWHRICSSPVIVPAGVVPESGRYFGHLSLSADSRLLRTGPALVFLLAGRQVARDQSNRVPWRHFIRRMRMFRQVWSIVAGMTGRETLPDCIRGAFPAPCRLGCKASNRTPAMSAPILFAHIERYDRNCYSDRRWLRRGLSKQTQPHLLSPVQWRPRNSLRANRKPVDASAATETMAVATHAAEGGEEEPSNRISPPHCYRRSLLRQRR